MKTLKKINKIRNKTKKNNEKILKNLNLTEKQKQIICKKYPTFYNTFEDKVEELFKKNKIDILSASYNLEKEVIKELKKAVSVSKIKPNNDFYSYINDRWLTYYDIEENQKYIVQVDNFRLVQDKVYRELIEIIENYINDSSKLKNSKKTMSIKNAYESFKINNTINQSRVISNNYVEIIESLRKFKDNIWKILANSNMNEIISHGSPFVWSINPDDKNPKIYKCYIEPPQVTLLDVEIYFDYKYDSEDEKKYKKKYRDKYFKFLKDLFALAFGENHGYNVKNVYDVEYELLNAMSCDLIKNSVQQYNLITKEDANTYFKFNWEEFCIQLGFNKIPYSFVTSNINYLLCGTKLLQEKWDSEEWKTYWIYLFIKQQYRWNDKGSSIIYEFECKFLRGQQKVFDPKIQSIFGMSFTFNTFLTNQYITNYKNQQTIDYVKTLVEDLRIVFMRIIKRNKWLQPKTKETALEKLKEIKLIVGSPEILREDPLLDYKSDDPWGNLIKMAIWRHSKAIELVGKHVIDMPVIDWYEFPPKFISTQAYIVNAMYTPTENSIYIPLGYVQQPFVDLEQRGIEYNLAHIGFTIAHEMCHSLDDYGSKYDKNGILHDWWTNKDKEQFRKIQENIVKQYEQYALYDGIKFDAWFSIGEDLADIAGFAICQEYLRDFQLKNQDVLPIKSISFEAFYTYFALQSRQKMSKKSILAQLKTNPHPLDKYRCNIPLSRSRIFRAIYNVKKGDKMWWDSFSNVWTD